MKIFHLNCGTMNGYGFPQPDGSGGFFKRGHGVIHCLLIETEAGLVLVDTGWGTRDCLSPTPATRMFMDVTGCARDPNETAIRQVESLGYQHTDVKHIFLTHLHLDHAGGLPDFPQATVHVYVKELDAYLHPRSLMDHRAYIPEHSLHGPKWRSHSIQGDEWFGLSCTPSLKVGGIEIVMIPLEGHTRGHCAVGVRIGKKWILHCGDVYGYYRQIDPVQPYTHPCGSLMEKIVVTGFKMPKRHWLTIRNLLGAYGDQVQAFCAHDAHEYNSLCE